MFSQFILFNTKIDKNQPTSANVPSPIPQKSKWLYSLVGIGVSGIIYSGFQKKPNDIIYYKSLKKRNEGKTLSDYNKRIRDTVVYFITGIGTISVLTLAISSKPSITQLLSSSFGIKLVPPSLLSLSLINLNKATQASSDSIRMKSLIKNTLFTCYNTSFALLIAPIVYDLNSVIVKKSLLLTGASCGLLSLISCLIKKSKHLKIASLLDTANGVFFFLGLSNVYFKSKTIESIYLYGGLGFYHGITVYTLKNMVLKARYQQSYDPIVESIDLYVAILNIFIHILRIVYDQQSKQ